jgi:hypothetical protein
VRTTFGPFDETAEPDVGDDVQSACAVCGEPIDIFLLLGLDWRHYRGQEPATTGQAP